jgi:hypothetical protein
MVGSIGANGLRVCEGFVPKIAYIWDKISIQNFNIHAVMCSLYPKGYDISFINYNYTR